MRNERVLMRDAGIVVSRFLNLRHNDLTEDDLLDEAAILVNERAIAAVEVGYAPLPPERVLDMAAALAAVAKACLDVAPVFAGRN
ncbi:hypothetical protein [Aquibium microcysteis]|uniref:hypothetical protein n=1 Tax=Aquibium microcysteis TaxID=675281 RepID=UPI00165D2F34|nr:hypothetical protein [Aquibium microcysteis]